MNLKMIIFLQVNTACTKIITSQQIKKSQSTSKMNFNNLN